MMVAREEWTSRSRLATPTELVAAAESAPAAIFTFDERGRVLASNRSCVDVFGWSREEPGPVPEPHRTARELDGSPRPWHGDYAFEHPRAGQRWLEGWSIPKADAGPAVWYGFALDVTARKRAELLLRARLELNDLGGEHTLEQLVGHALEVAESFTASGASLFLLPSAASPPGAGFELWSKGGTSLFAPEDRKALADTWRQAAPAPCAQRAGPYAAIVVPVLRADEVHARLAVIGKRADYTSEDVSALQVIASAVLEVVERKRTEEKLRASEERYRTLVEDMENIVWASDRDGRVTYVSGAIRTLGYTAEEVVGRSILEFVHPGDVADVDRRRAKVLEGDTGAAELRLLDKGGHVRVFRNARRPLVRDGQIVGVSGVLSDITQQRQTEEQLRTAQKMEAVGRLAGGIAHDFNNLLSVILSFAEFAMGSVHEGDPLRGDLLEIKKAGDRAAALTRQLLAFSRRQVLQPEVVPLNQIVAGLQSMLRRLISEDIELAVELSPAAGNVRVDVGQIEQVIMNLAVNARDAMPEGGRLGIETANVEVDASYAMHHMTIQPGSYVMLSVTDTGVGMDAATLGRLFEPFFTTKEKGKGTGLGLATVYGIVKQSGGGVWVYSEVGRGTTFKVLLPRELGGCEVAAGRNVRAAPAQGRGELILVVEDEDAVRQLAKRVLRGAGYEVLTAANGGEALLLCEHHGDEIDLLLTDVVMPQMSGKELAERLRKVLPSIRVLFMSGYTENAIVHHGGLDGSMAFIAKPFSSSDLTNKVREVLDLPVD